MDDLEQRLLSTRYSVVDGMKNVSESLEKEKKLRIFNLNRLRQVRKKVASLEGLRRKSVLDFSKMQRKLVKLQETQGFAVAMVHSKLKNQMEKHKELQARREECWSMREDTRVGLQNSQALFAKRRMDRIRKIKEEEFSWHEQYLKETRRSQEEANRKKSAVKLGEEKMKARLKRFEEYKLRKARENYNSKVRKEINSQKQKKIYLTELRREIEHESQVFSKTQILDHETSRIQSIYLTGHS